MFDVGVIAGSRHVLFVLCLSFTLICYLTPSVEAQIFEGDQGVRVEVNASFYSGPAAQLSCVSLRNVSVPPSAPPYFQKKIIGFGFYSSSNLDSKLHLLSFSSFGASFAPVTELPGHEKPTANILVAATGFAQSLDNGLSIGQSARFCMSLLSTNDLSPSELLNRFFVVLDDGVYGCGLFENPQNLYPQSDAIIEVEFLSSDRACVSAVNGSPFSAITGIGFALPSDRRSFSLSSINPSPQYESQQLFFSNSEGRLRLPEYVGSPELSFALLTGGTFDRGLSQFGVPGPGAAFNVSSRFCISGNFGGLDGVAIVNRVLVRFPESYRTITKLCPEISIPSGGLKGTVATNPQ